MREMLPSIGEADAGGEGVSLGDAAAFFIPDADAPGDMLDTEGEEGALADTADCSSPEAAAIPFRTQARESS